MSIPLPTRHRLAGSVLAAALLWACLAVASAPAQVNVPAATPTTREVNLDAASEAEVVRERTPIGLTQPEAPGRRATTASAAAAEAQRSVPFDLARMAIALTIVLGLIFGARWLVTHFFVSARAPSTSRAVKVLGRTSLAPRQQVLLLQVGRRVVVVGESNGQLSTLAQLDDPDEVASLVGQLQEEQIQRAAAFGGMFGRMQKKFAADEDEHAPRELAEIEGQTNEPSVEPATDPQARSELAGLLDKVRSIRDQLGRQ